MVFGRAALVPRCQIHKTRNILDHLPERQRSWVLAILKRAYQSKDVKTATRLLRHLARRLDQEHPCAAASVREGLEETVTVLTLGLSPRLQRSLAELIVFVPDATRRVQMEAANWPPPTGPALRNPSACSARHGSGRWSWVSPYRTMLSHSIGLTHPPIA